MAYCRAKHLGFSQQRSLSSLLGRAFSPYRTASNSKTTWDQDNSRDTMVGPDLPIHEALQYVAIHEFIYKFDLPK